MWYQIIDTKTSENERISYSLFKRVKSVEALTADTYGIIAADCDESFSIDDITTDINEINMLLKSLCAKSVKPKEFLPFVLKFVDSL